jgi:hypothetical protein
MRRGGEEVPAAKRFPYGDQGILKLRLLSEVNLNASCCDGEERENVRACARFGSSLQCWDDPGQLDAGLVSAAIHLASRPESRNESEMKDLPISGRVRANT